MPKFFVYRFSFCHILDLATDEYQKSSMPFPHPALPSFFPLCSLGAFLSPSDFFTLSKKVSGMSFPAS